MTKTEILQTAKPILFSGEMVRAILAGSKTQTRRVIKERPTVLPWFDAWGDNGGNWVGLYNVPLKHQPYNKGTLLYVRETFARVGDFTAFKADVYYNMVGASNSDYSLAPSFYADTLTWKPSIHMPKSAARLFLRVTDVRAERLQNISNRDCVAEGLDFEAGAEKCGEQYLAGLCNLVTTSDISKTSDCEDCYYTKRNTYKRLWDKLNAKRGYGWETNPWVWVYTFERVVPTE
jgi:hypothetical protein